MDYGVNILVCFCARSANEHSGESNSSDILFEKLVKIEINDITQLACVAAEM